MRKLKFVDRGDLKPKEIFLEIVKQPTGGAGRNGVVVEEMRLDIRLLDRLEGPEMEVELEDADWTHLCKKIRAFPFAVANRDLMAICDDVLNAPEGVAKK